MPVVSGPQATAIPDAVVLDASVLYQEPVRSLLLWIGSDGVFRPRWSDRILFETAKNLVKTGACTTEQARQMVGAMQRAFPDAGVEQPPIDAIEKDMPNDPKDRHVLACAVVDGADLVVTNNLKHFRGRDLKTVGKVSVNADNFLCELLERFPTVVRDALQQQASTTTRPRAWTSEELLGRLAGLGESEPLAPRFAHALAERLGVVPVAPPPRQVS